MKHKLYDFEKELVRKRKNRFKEIHLWYGFQDIWIRTVPV